MIPPGIGPGYPRCKRGVLPLDYGILNIKKDVDF